jgi:hypothetical protein
MLKVLADVYRIQANHDAKPPLRSEPRAAKALRSIVRNARATSCFASRRSAALPS